MLMSGNSNRQVFKHLKISVIHIMRELVDLIHALNELHASPIQCMTSLNVGSSDISRHIQIHKNVRLEDLIMGYIPRQYFRHILIHKMVRLEDQASKCN